MIHRQGKETVLWKAVCFSEPSFRGSGTQSSGYRRAKISSQYENKVLRKRLSTVVWVRNVSNGLGDLNPGFPVGGDVQRGSAALQGTEQPLGEGLEGSSLAPAPSPVSALCVASAVGWDLLPLFLQTLMKTDRTWNTEKFTLSLREKKKTKENS